MLQIRSMHRNDIPFAIRLSNQEKWGITQDDLERILTINAKGSFIAYQGSRRIGLTTTTSYGKELAWIGNVIVDERHRGEHAGQKLVEHAVAYLQKDGFRHIGLYCFKETGKFYEKLGFLRNTSFLRLLRRAKKLHSIPRQSSKWRLPLSKVLNADRRAFGADRSNLIRLVLAKKAGWYLGSSRGSANASYLMVKEYEDMREFGPWICVKPAKDEPKEMLLNALSRSADKPIEVSCLRSNRRALSLLKNNGFQEIREGYRMYFDENPEIGDDSLSYALGFLDKG